MSENSQFFNPQLKHAQLLGLLLSFFLFFSLTIWLMIPAIPAGFYWDDAWYLLMAEWYAEQSDQQQLVWDMMQHRQYPPLLPYILSFTNNVLFDQTGANLVNGFFLAMGTSLTVILLVHEKVPVSIAFVAASLIVILPVALGLMPFVISEHLYILLTTLTLLLVARSQRSETLFNWLLIGFLTGLCVATRTAGWMMVLAALSSLIGQRQFTRLRFYVPGLIAGLLVTVYLRAGLPTRPGYLSIYLQEIRETGPIYLINQVSPFLDGWLGLWDSPLVAITTGMIMLPGLVIRLSEHKIDAWYLLFSLLLIYIWPFPEQYARFLWVLLPSILLAMFSTVNLINLPRRRKLISAALVLFLAGMNIEDGLARSSLRLINMPDDGVPAYSRMREWTRAPNRDVGKASLRVVEQLMQDMESIKQHVEKDDCIYSDWPSIVFMHTLVPTYPVEGFPNQSMDTIGENCEHYYALPWMWLKDETRDLKSLEKNSNVIFRSTTLNSNAQVSTVGIFFSVKPRNWD